MYVCMFLEIFPYFQFGFLGQYLKMPMDGQVVGFTSKDVSAARARGCWALLIVIIIVIIC